MTAKNKLGLFDFTMIVIGLVIGMGIFRTAKDAASAGINPTIYFSRLDCRWSLWLCAEL
jgi:APA family basic amino acid/polyamine antiporter